MYKCVIEDFKFSRSLHCKYSLNFVSYETRVLSCCLMAKKNIVLKLTFKMY